MKLLQSYTLQLWTFAKWFPCKQIPASNISFSQLSLLHLTYLATNKHRPGSEGSLRVSFQSVVHDNHMKAVEQLPLVLVDSLHLYIKHGVGIEDNAVLVLHVVSKPVLVLLQATWWYNNNLDNKNNNSNNKNKNNGNSSANCYYCFITSIQKKTTPKGQPQCQFGW